MKSVIVYIKPECSLCGDVMAVLERARLRTPFALDEVDISTDPALRRRYSERVPVVAVDGVEAFDYLVDEQELQRLLEAPARGEASPSPASGA
jgi:hypothetical protein